MLFKIGNFENQPPVKQSSEEGYRLSALEISLGVVIFIILVFTELQ